MTIEHKFPTTDKGWQVIDAGTDLARARVQAQSYATEGGTEAYLCERGADEDDFETFAAQAKRRATECDHASDRKCPLGTSCSRNDESHSPPYAQSVPCQRCGSLICPACGALEWYQCL